MKTIQGDNASYVAVYLKAVEWVEGFYKYLLELGYKCKIEYSYSLLVYEKLVDINDPDINFGKVGHWQNTWLHMNSAQYGTDKPFLFGMCKYANGEHVWYPTSAYSDISFADYDYFLKKAIEFFGLPSVSPKPVQMSLFDFLDADGNLV